MLDQIINSLKSEVGGEILSKTNLPSDKLDDVFSIVGKVAGEKVMGEMSGGGLSTVLNLFSNQANSGAANQLQSSITNSVVSGIVSKLGLSQGVANTIAGIVIPALMNLITKKNSQTPDNDPSPLNEIFGGGGGLGGKVGKILGKFF